MMVNIWPSVYRTSKRSLQRHSVWLSLPLRNLSSVIKNVDKRQWKQTAHKNDTRNKGGGKNVFFPNTGWQKKKVFPNGKILQIIWGLEDKAGRDSLLFGMPNICNYDRKSLRSAKITIVGTITITVIQSAGKIAWCVFPSPLILIQNCVRFLTYHSICIHCLFLNVQHFIFFLL